MLVEMNNRGIPVTVGADAHEPGRVGDRFVAALQLLQRSGYEVVSYFRQRQRHDLRIDKVLPGLQTHASGAGASE